MYYFISHEIFATYEIDIVINSHFIEVKKSKPRHKVTWSLAEEKNKSEVCLG